MDAKYKMKETMRRSCELLYAAVVGMEKIIFNKKIQMSQKSFVIVHLFFRG